MDRKINPIMPLLPDEDYTTKGDRRYSIPQFVPPRSSDIRNISVIIDIVFRV